MNLKINAQDYLQKLKLISVALDKVQNDVCTISEATEIWIDLVNNFNDQFAESDVAHCIKRFEMAMTPAHYLANLLDHRFRGIKLTNSQKRNGVCHCFLS